MSKIKIERKVKAEIVKRMNALDIKVVALDYSGSGDSGGVDSFDYYKKWNEDHDAPVSPSLDVKDDDQLNQLCEDVLETLVNPDFNNDGSSGTAYFILLEGNKLKFYAHHSNYYTTSDDSTFEQKL